MIEKLSQRSTLVCSAGLSAIYRVEGLIEEETNSPTCVYPRWTIRIKRWVIPQESQKVDNHKAEASEGDLVEVSGIYWEK
jgi:hypothetical protein